jgi:hypothetical protein
MTAMPANLHTVFSGIFQDHFGNTFRYAEQIDVVFDAFFDAIDGNNKARNLEETIMEINGDPAGWANRFAMKCQIELERMGR